jgi:hypothetical protein
VDVRVEGVREPTAGAAPGAKLCERLTRRLEEDIGQPVQRTSEQARVEDLDRLADTDRRPQDLRG